MAITFTICAANGPPEWIQTALPEDATYAAVQRVVGDRLGGPMAHLRFGQLSILVNEAAELAGEPLNIMATAILRAYLGARGAWAAEFFPEIHGVAIIPDQPLVF
jgi:hypothetical protein